MSHIFSTAHLIAKKGLRRELTVWQSLKHKNIVPIVGVMVVSGTLLSIVSERMSNGMALIKMKVDELHSELFTRIVTFILKDIPSSITSLAH
jgi:serine/threonine protein kinase